MVDPINTLPWEGFAYKITDRPCVHFKDGRHVGDCSVCVRDVLVEVAEKAAKEERERLMGQAMKLAYCESCRTVKFDPEPASVTDYSRGQFAELNVVPKPGQVVVYCGVCNCWKSFNVVESK